MSQVLHADAITVTVLVPLAIRRRNGRSRLVLPDDGDRQPAAHDRAGDTVLRAIARAWDWRRRLEAGEASTLQDIATAEALTLSFVSRRIRLAYLAPAVLARILRRAPVALSLDALTEAAAQPWERQVGAVEG